MKQICEAVCVLARCVSFKAMYVCVYDLEFEDAFYQNKRSTPLLQHLSFSIITGKSDNLLHIFDTTCSCPSNLQLPQLTSLSSHSFQITVNVSEYIRSFFTRALKAHHVKTGMWIMFNYKMIFPDMDVVSLLSHRPHSRSNTMLPLKERCS